MFKLFISFLIPILFFQIIRSQYAIIQANHYEIRKYFKYELKKKCAMQIIQFALLIISFRIDNLLYLLVFAFSLVLNVSLLNKEKLKYTKRIKRFLLGYYLITCIMYNLLPFNEIASILVLNNLILLLVVICHFVSLTLESIIMNYYIKDARKIIKDIKVIGVTGSYGKTSSKNIIYDMLEGICNVSKTPKSFNTKVGIVKSIRENVDTLTDAFICEYGVDRKGGMDSLLKIAKPNISLITEVGPQHLLTFKNIENIINEKIKVAKVLKEDEIAIINNDNIYLKNEINKLKCKVITYGIKENSDIMAKNIVANRMGSSFDLYVNYEYIERVTIKLLGEHNILNTLGAVGVLKSLNINLENIGYLTSKIKPIEHRLELKTINGIRVIDDSFNSNEVGFKKAIDTLCLMEGKKIVITPGIIEQGKNSDKVNYELGMYMGDKIDFAILVEKNSNIIREGLIDKGFSENKIIFKNNFLEAWEFVKKIEENNKIILIENDLPSIYLR